MFTHPFLLWGLLLAFIPLMIHLINLLRHRPVEWGAMEFLLAAYRKHKTRVRMKEILLLLMRMGLVILLVLMLAGPVIQRALPGGAKTHHVILLDDSFSMSDRFGETSAFENAKRTIQKLTEELIQLGGTHNLTLLRTSQAREGHRLADLHEQRLGKNFFDHFSFASLEPSFSAGGITEALKYAAELAPETTSENRTLYLVSDFREKDWKKNPALTAQLEEMNRNGFKIRLLDCVSSEHTNLAVSELKPEEGIRAAGVPLLMSVKVQNFGLTAAKNVVLRPEIFLKGAAAETAQAPKQSDGSVPEKPNGSTSETSNGSAPAQSAGQNGRQIPPSAESQSPKTSSQTVNQTLPVVTLPEIPAGETISASFPVTFPIPGNYGVRVSLAPDSIQTDNQVCAAFSIPAFESVLLIDDSIDASTSRFLRTALAPGDRIQTGVVPRVEKARFLSTNDLRQFQSIYLLDTASLEPQAVTALENFVKSGGGLCIFTGPNTDPIAAQKWYRNGEGFFPVLLDQVESLPKYYAAPDLRVGAHSIFRIFAAERNAQFNSIRIENYYSLDDSTLETLIPLQDESVVRQKERQNQKLTQHQQQNSQTEASVSPDATGDVQTIAALRNNSPLVLERTYGKGKIILFLTSADRTWTDWPVGNPARPNPFAQGSYVVMLLQLQAYLTRQPFVSQRVGDLLQVEFSPEQFKTSVQFLKPDASVWEQVSASISPTGQQNAQSSPTLQPGVFQVKLQGLTGTEELRLFAVNPDVQEGMVQKISRKELAETLRAVPFDFFSADSFHFSAADSPNSSISDWLLALILVWILLEMLLAASASWHLSSPPAGPQKNKFAKLTARRAGADENVQKIGKAGKGGEK